MEEKQCDICGTTFTGEHYPVYDENYKKQSGIVQCEYCFGRTFYEENEDNMKTIKIIIERSADAYSAYAENLEGVSGMGDTVEEAKQSVMESIQIQRKLGNIKLKEGLWGVKFQYDMQSFLNYYKGNGIFTLAALERITGIPQGYLKQYSTGEKKPRAERKKEIQKALNNLGAELMALEL